jgi:hypothetical protein
VISEEQIWTFYHGLILSPDIERIRKLLVRYELFKMSVDVPGDIVECGVFKGVGLLYWLKLLRIYAPGAQKRVIGFDTFGPFANSLLPYEQRATENYLRESHFDEVGLEAIRELTAQAGFVDEVELVAGDVMQTAAQFVADNPGFRISLLHLDLDTYHGTKAALEALYPVVTRGGIIVLDEYGDRGWGASDAVDEYFADRTLELRSVPFSRKPTSYIVKH